MAFLEKLSGGPLTLAKLLRSIREGEAMTQAQFADTLGISKQGGRLGGTPWGQRLNSE